MSSKFVSTASYGAIQPMLMTQQKRTVTAEWSAALFRHIEAQPRGYQRRLAEKIGADEGEISRLKNGTTVTTKWAGAISEHTGIPLPPLTMDDKQSEVLSIYERLSGDRKELALDYLRMLDAKAAAAAAKTKKNSE